MQSHNQRTKIWLRLEETSEAHLVHPPAQAGPPRPFVQDCVQVAFEYLQGQRLHNLPGQPVPALCHPHSKKVFPDSQREPPLFQFVPIASCPVTGHHWKEPDSMLFSPPLLVFLYIDKIPPGLLLIESQNH